VIKASAMIQCASMLSALCDFWYAAP